MSRTKKNEAWQEDLIKVIHDGTHFMNVAEIIGMMVGIIVNMVTADKARQKGGEDVSGKN